MDSTPLRLAREVKGLHTNERTLFDLGSHASLTFDPLQQRIFQTGKMHMYKVFNHFRAGRTKVRVYTTMILFILVSAIN